MIDETELSRIEKLANDATAGPWEYDGQHYEIHTPYGHDGYWLIASECQTAPNKYACDEFGHQFSPDFSFIAASRQAVPELIAEVRRLRWLVENPSPTSTKRVLNDPTL